MNTYQKLMILISLLFQAAALFFLISTIIEWRRHKRLMKLFDQADAVNKQVCDAVRRGDVDSARFHHERYVELSEMIGREIEKSKS